MSKRKFTDHFGNTVANFDRVLKYADKNKIALTLKEQIELERTNQIEQAIERTKSKKEPERYIQDNPYFNHGG